jgi:anti-anti-sigma regulatory factor
MARVADPQHRPQPVVITLPAQIDMANAGCAGQQLGSALTPGVTTVTADMTATTFCDSSGISMLIRARNVATCAR